MGKIEIAASKTKTSKVEAVDTANDNPGIQASAASAKKYPKTAKKAKASTKTDDKNDVAKKDSKAKKDKSSKKGKNAVKDLKIKDTAKSKTVEKDKVSKFLISMKKSIRKQVKLTATEIGISMNDFIVSSVLEKIEKIAGRA
jgi:predicted HicB family RNase H-like nuclease